MLDMLAPRMGLTTLCDKAKMGYGGLTCRRSPAKSPIASEDAKPLQNIPQRA